ncbi:MAG: CDP-alcohol phosphatidyltransferase family protein [Frankiaceae bacterium]|nr:CDP-alcohol phosphatidyltransferase family protein [Frankiaceae bacterium]
MGTVSIREARRQLASAQKSNRGAAGYSRWINRPLGRQFAAVLYVWGATPNQVSLLSAAFTYSAICSLAVFPPTWPLAIWVTAGLIVGYALDSADGQVARLSGAGSPAGEWLDHVLDSAKIAMFHAAVAICWFRWYHLDRPAWLLVPLAFGAASSVFFFALILSDMLRRIDRLARTGSAGSAAATSTLNPKEAAPVLRSLLVLPNDYGLLCLVMLLIPLHSVFRSAYTVLAVCSAAFLAMGTLRWLREMRTFAK